LRPEVVENQFQVPAKRSSDLLLHGLDAGTHALTAPLVEKLPGPGGRVVAEEIAQSEALLGLQIAA
jgi:hypothetical protein